MSVPLDISPGYNDPRSPLYTGGPCQSCGRGDSHYGLCPQCEAEEGMRAAYYDQRADEYEREQRIRREAEAVAGGEPTDYELQRREPPRHHESSPREVRVTR